MSGATPVPDLLAEARRVVDGAAGAGVVARVLGGVGVALHDHGPVPTSLQREYGDIDIVVPAKATRGAAAALVGLGYQANDRFNALHGARRLLFYDTANARQLDVFVGVFAMCHQLDLSGRLGEHPTALDAADLLLTKLQIAEINRKDVVDGVRLLHTHEVAGRDVPPAVATSVTTADVLSVDRLRAVTSADWGWYTTFTDNLARLRDAVPELLGEGPTDATDATDAAAAAVVVDRIDRVQAALADAPKSIRWRARSVVGRKTPWYELPEEVDRGAAR